MTTQKTVHVSCTASHQADLSSFVPFQGDLKVLSPESKAKLKSEILLRGFSFPLFVWQQDGIRYLLDGHQRFAVLNELRNEGYVIPEIPYDIVEADSIQEAKTKLLGVASQYGTFNHLGLIDFVKTAELKLEDLTTIKLPGINLSRISLDFLAPPTMPTDGEKVKSTKEKGVRIAYADAEYAEFIEKTKKLSEIRGVTNLSSLLLSLVREEAHRCE